MIDEILEYFFIGLFGIILIWALIIDCVEDGKENYQDTGNDKDNQESDNESDNDF